MIDLFTNNIAIPFILWTLAIMGSAFSLKFIFNQDVFFKTKLPFLKIFIPFILFLVLISCVGLSIYSSLTTGNRVIGSFHEYKKIENSNQKLKKDFNEIKKNDMQVILEYNSLPEEDKHQLNSYINNLKLSENHLRKASNETILSGKKLIATEKKYLMESLKLFFLSLISFLFYFILLIILLMHTFKKTPEILIDSKTYQIVKQISKDRFLIEHTTTNNYKIITIEDLRDKDISYK